jgi:hypothetical protein
MTDPRDERPPLDDAEKTFVERLASEYAPAPMTASGRAVFDEGIRARLERPRRRAVPIPAVGLAAAAALAWVVLSYSTGPTSLPGGEGSGAMVASSWEDELFLSSDLSASEDRDESEALPEDYLAIAGVFLGG